MNNVIHMLHGMTGNEKIEIFEGRLNSLISKDSDEASLILKRVLTTLETSLYKKENSYEKPDSTHLLLATTSFILNVLTKYKAIVSSDVDDIYGNLYGEILDSVMLITEYSTKNKLSNIGFTLVSDEENKVNSIFFIYELNEKHNLVFNIKVN